MLRRVLKKQHQRSQDSQQHLDRWTQRHVAIERATGDHLQSSSTRFSSAPAQEEAKEIDLDELFGTKDASRINDKNTFDNRYRYEEDNKYNGADIDAASVEYHHIGAH
ncbi:MAG: hypothetical protein MHM6MM_009393 [Cercozoa sp. M6MM]